ncbi:uncharacterized protein PHALS_08342 [Plasmopara halstedii]|uniref:Uncharacterized protein n=1 Tax=Plasmopara halstedii TaxID=4781 RepID=A0A0P1AD37_PLAHL|nr:uncharacterized protein PHALS_08342 [Plasmopara halstedii]CEG38257.1 hypothetical protein PHALS_08342 [Plasmopara halstedii]|eukprot:XP_024574626.1 hypothetical protein PHALS_08342 [Plasmopara halstedii]
MIVQNLPVITEAIEHVSHERSVPDLQSQFLRILLRVVYVSAEENEFESFTGASEEQSRVTAGALGSMVFYLVAACAIAKLGWYARSSM